MFSFSSMFTFSFLYYIMLLVFKLLFHVVVGSLVSCLIDAVFLVDLVYFGFKIYNSLVEYLDVLSCLVLDPAELIFENLFSIFDLFVELAQEVPFNLILIRSVLFYLIGSTVSLYLVLRPERLFMNHDARYRA